MSVQWLTRHCVYIAYEYVVPDGVLATWTDDVSWLTL